MPAQQRGSSPRSRHSVRRLHSRRHETGDRPARVPTSQWLPPDSVLQSRSRQGPAYPTRPPCGTRCRHTIAILSPPTEDVPYARYDVFRSSISLESSRDFGRCEDGSDLEDSHDGGRRNRWFRPLPGGERLAVLTTKGELTVFIVETGKPIWTKIAIKEQSSPYWGEIHLNFSANASRLFMDAQRKRPLVFNVESGELLPALENVPLITTLANCFSPDGRLLFLCGDHSRPPRKDGVATVNDELGRFMSVWDTDSGKLLKQWANHIPSAAVFHPTKPHPRHPRTQWREYATRWASGTSPPKSRRSDGLA